MSYCEDCAIKDRHVYVLEAETRRLTTRYDKLLAVLKDDKMAEKVWKYWNSENDTCPQRAVNAYRARVLSEVEK